MPMHFTPSLRHTLAAMSIAASPLAGCATGVVSEGDNGVKSNPSMFAEILAGAPASSITSACVVVAPEGTCAASLVAPGVVLTAGHCVSGRSSFRVTCPNAGDSAARSSVETAIAPSYPGGGEMVDARRGSNLALIKLDRPFPSSSAARVVLEHPPVRPRGMAVGRVTSRGVEQLMVSRAFVLNYLEPSNGYSLGVDRVIVQPGDAGGGLYDSETQVLFGVASSSMAVTACRVRSVCSQWASIAPSAAWFRTTLQRWGQTLVMGDPGDIGEGDPPVGDGGAPPSDAGGPPPPDGGGDPGDIGEEPPPEGDPPADSGVPASMPPTGSDPCASHSSCAACTAVAVCGWCNGRCTLGLPFGPIDAAMCAGQPWTWSTSQCR